MTEKKKTAKKAAKKKVAKPSSPDDIDAIKQENAQLKAQLKELQKGKPASDQHQKPDIKVEQPPGQNNQQSDNEEGWEW